MKTVPWLLLLFLPLLAVAEESALNLPPPAPSAYRYSPLERPFSVVAWPGYSIAAQDSGPQGKAQKYLLVVERAAFAFDFASTAKTIYPGSRLEEKNAINTAFGAQNRPAILASMTGWELAFSYAAAKAPRWFGPRPLRRAVRAASILATGFLIEEHIRAGACNLRLAGQSDPRAANSCMLLGR